jgi:ribonuclease HII
MGILIGMDEAGYGPHYGPLVIAATAWEVTEEAEVRGQGSGERSNHRLRSAAMSSVPGSGTTRLAIEKTESGCVDLYRLLRNTVAKRASDRRVAIADSKVLYHPGLGLRQLERGLHAVLLTMQQRPGCWSELVEHCGADPECCHRRVCWPDEFECSLPLDADAKEVVRLGSRFARACGAVGIRPLMIRARLVFPEQFNDLIAHFGNKATALSHVTIGLLREVVDSVAPGSSPGLPVRTPIHAVCDKHGGRNFYTALLQHHFSEHWISPTFESHVESHYEWGTDDHHVRVCFRMNGEAFMPTALASMTAKYLRELAMRAFNEFWRAHLPGLKPTAGYYRDAWRFKSDIAAKQRELGIDDYTIWRNR